MCIHFKRSRVFLHASFKEVYALDVSITDEHNFYSAESSYSRLRINSEGCYKTGLKSDICQV